ncbi:hypothetical protein AVEN_160865-1 [Araneus ventricosus]|uniref:Uncharacterized protein n=1 Tax=Araneus ventricosus TaxID=182803 RepID=A0A4Y2NFE5_ARAVE|nr:hypothetical protein AVEN_160865-1 [Araneus ventricosus]
MVKEIRHTKSFPEALIVFVTAFTGQTNISKLCFFDLGGLNVEIVKISSSIFDDYNFSVCFIMRKAKRINCDVSQLMVTFSTTLNCHLHCRPVQGVTGNPLGKAKRQQLDDKHVNFSEFVLRKV